MVNINKLLIILLLVLIHAGCSTQSAVQTNASALEEDIPATEAVEPTTQEAVEADEFQDETSTAHIPHWEIDDTDVVIPLDLAALWDATQGVYAIPGVAWGTDKAALLDYYGVSDLSEYPIVNPELWFTFTLDNLPFNMAVEFGFNENIPHCCLYTNNRNSRNLDRQAQLLLAALTQSYGESEYEHGGAEYFVDYKDAEQWEVQFYTWKADAPEEGFSQLELDITLCQGVVQEIQIGLFRIHLPIG